MKEYIVGIKSIVNFNRFVSYEMVIFDSENCNAPVIFELPLPATMSVV